MLLTQMFTAISKIDNGGLQAGVQGMDSSRWHFGGIVAHSRTNTSGSPSIKSDQALLNIFFNRRKTSFTPKFVCRNANEKSSEVIGAFMCGL